METFLIVTSIIFFIFGLLLLLSPAKVEKIAKVTNIVLFTIDDKIHTVRRPMGIIFLVLTVFLWFVLLSK